MIGTDIDPIDLEVLRSRLEAVGEQACRAIEQTAVSPAITESKDYSVTLLDADGGQVIQRDAQADGRGEIRRARLKSVRRFLIRAGEEINVGDHVAAAQEWRHRFQHFAASVEHSDAGGPADFVSGKGQKVTTDFSHIHWTMTDALGTVH